MSGAPLPEGLLNSLLDEVEAADAVPASAPPSNAAPPSGAPIAGTGSAPGGGVPSADLLNVLPGLMRMMGQQDKGKGGGKVSDRHTALLRALKPYLSPTRRSAVDTLLTLAGVWDTLSGMGLRLPPPGTAAVGSEARSAVHEAGTAGADTPSDGGTGGGG